MLALVQYWGLGSPGGGPRILRSLLKDAPYPFVSICTQPASPSVPSDFEELHIPMRPHFGRMESTRFGKIAGCVTLALAGSFEGRLEAVFVERKVCAVHAIPHNIDFWHAFRAARKLNLPYVLNVHDEMTYGLAGRPELEPAMRHLGEVWNEANGRMVISKAMGREYCRRYGKAEYEIVTDGLTDIREAPRPRLAERLHVYFMGALHLSYRPNFHALYKALEIFQQHHPEVSVKFICRGSSFPGKEGSVSIEERPWAPQEQVENDLSDVDALYLPMPFDEAVKPFAQFSLSTKMVTYLGSGLPILYHGPNYSAAGDLLNIYSAAVLSYTLDPRTIADSIERVDALGETVSTNALMLGRTQFSLPDQRQRFWHTIERWLPTRSTT